MTVTTALGSAVTPAPSMTSEAPDLERARSGMWIFLATELLFFGGLFAAYAWGRFTWPEGFAAASCRSHVVIGTVNTALLLTSSALVALAVACSEVREQQRKAGLLLAVAATIGVAFLALKGVEYAQEFREHLVPGPGFALADQAGAALFFFLYFVMTGLHAVHVAIGVTVLGVFAWGSHRSTPWAPPRRIEAAGLYWHFVDVIWILLYPLLYLVNRHS